jgi:outer membrane lipoprotein-sorting protein
MAVSGLGRFLEVIYGPNVPFSTAYGTIRQWRNRDLADSASGGGRRAMGRKIVSKEKRDQAPTIQETSISMWISLPNRFRIEKNDKSEKHVEPRLVVVNGDEWWSRDDQGHVETSTANEQQARRRTMPGLTDIQRHFDHASLREYFVDLSLQESGSVETAGRSCIRLRAVPRSGARLWPHWLPDGADEYEFHADPERGVLLYVAGRYSGEVFELSQVLQVAFDGSLDDGLFTYTPRQGEQVRPADPIVEHLTLEAAILRMPFTVLIPRRVPDSESRDFEVMYHSPRPRCRPFLSLMYRGRPSLWINEGDSADPELAKMEWEQVERDGKRMLISDPGAGAGMRVISLEQSGTHVAVWSDLDRDRLIDVAASLVPASEVHLI